MPTHAWCEKEDAWVPITEAKKDLYRPIKEALERANKLAVKLHNEGRKEDWNELREIVLPMAKTARLLKAGILDRWISVISP